MTIESNRSIGGVAAILTITGVISTVFSIFRIGSTSNISVLYSAVTGIVGLLVFIGFILFLVAMYGFSKDYAEKNIFNHVLNGFIFALIAGFVAAIVGGLVFVSIAIGLGQFGIANLPPFAVGLLLIAFAVVQLIYVVFVNKGLNLLAYKSGSNQLYTATRIFLLGAALNVILSTVFTMLGLTNLIGSAMAPFLLLPGSLVQYIAWYFAAKGFYAIKPPVAPIPPAQPYYPPYTAGQVRYCSNCGTQVQPGDAYCVRCGKKL
jgi:uncharacterized membrane protein